MKQYIKVNIFGEKHLKFPRVASQKVKYSNNNARSYI